MNLLHRPAESFQASATVDQVGYKLALIGSLSSSSKFGIVELK